jgi:transcription elongation factor Elf1
MKKLSPTERVTALEKAIAKTPEKDEKYNNIYHCPFCNKMIVDDFLGLPKYCENCGQKLDWSFINE